MLDTATHIYVDRSADAVGITTWVTAGAAVASAFVGSMAVVIATLQWRAGLYDRRWKVYNAAAALLEAVKTESWPQSDRISTFREATRHVKWIFPDRVGIYCASLLTATEEWVKAAIEWDVHRSIGGSTKEVEESLAKVPALREEAELKRARIVAMSADLDKHFGRSLKIHANWWDRLHDFIGRT